LSVIALSAFMLNIVVSFFMLIVAVQSIIRLSVTNLRVAMLIAVAPLGGRTIDI
jgi:hypothetical protein